MYKDKQYTPIENSELVSHKIVLQPLLSVGCDGWKDGRRVKMSPTQSVVHAVCHEEDE